MAGLTPAVESLIEKYRTWKRKLEAPLEEPTVHADEVVTALATGYEKIRRVVDWKEEHLMRRIAVERILKRRFYLNELDAEPFVLELVSGGHFPNDYIPKSKIKLVQNAINKYKFILDHLPPVPSGKTEAEVQLPIFQIASCEIEQILDPFSYQRADILIECMQSLMREKIRLGKRALDKKIIDESKKETLLYVAIQQALFKFDSSVIYYNLLKKKYSNWFEISKAELSEVSQKFYSILDEFESILNHPLAGKFYKLCERYDTPFLLLGDIIRENFEDIDEKIADSKTLESLTAQAYLKRLSTLKTRSYRAALYATISVFLTNVFALYLIEIPFVKLTGIGFLNPWARLFDIFGPTLLMFFLVGTIKLPPEENLKLVIEEVKRICYGTNEAEVHEIDVYPESSLIVKIILKFLFTLSFLISWGIVVFLAYLFNFPPLSYLILVIFTALIAYTGTIIRERAKELHVIETKATFIDSFFSQFALPVLHLGKWLSSKWRKINIVGIIFNLLVEVPFRTFVEFIAQWRYFLKEQRDRIH